MQYLITIKSFGARPGRNRPARCHVVLIRNTGPGSCCQVMVEDRQGRTQWPQRIDNQIIWDRPEHITKELRVLVRRAYRYLDRLQKEGAHGAG